MRNSPFSTLLVARSNRYIIWITFKICVLNENSDSDLLKVRSSLHYEKESSEEASVLFISLACIRDNIV